MRNTTPVPYRFINSVLVATAWLNDRDSGPPRLYRFITYTPLVTFLFALARGKMFLNYGCAQERPRAVKAGAWGDAIFRAETLVRPDILSSILRQGYAALWTDVDIVWLGNPLPLLPDLRDPTSVRE